MKGEQVVDFQGRTNVPSVATTGTTPSMEILDAQRAEATILMIEACLKELRREDKKAVAIRIYNALFTGGYRRVPELKLISVEEIIANIDLDSEMSYHSSGRGSVHTLNVYPLLEAQLAADRKATGQMAIASKGVRREG